MRRFVAGVVMATVWSIAAADDEAVEPKLDLRELVKQTPQMSVPKAKKKQQPVVKGAAYLLTYEADDGNWYETEVVATGRSATYCDGVRYEVDADDFTTFVKPKELRRIRGSR